MKKPPVIPIMESEFDDLTNYNGCHGLVAPIGVAVVVFLVIVVIFVSVIVNVVTMKAAEGDCDSRAKNILSSTLPWSSSPFSSLSSF